MSLSPLKQPNTIRKTSLRIVPEPLVKKEMARKATPHRRLPGQLSGDFTSNPQLSEQIAPDKAAVRSASAKTVLKAGTSSADTATADRLKQSSSLHTVEIPLCELPNNELVIRCQAQSKQDRAAFEELVNRYQRYVDKLLYHLASDWSDRADLAQEVWIRVYRSIHRLKEPAKFKSWLGRITTNLFYDELRKRKRYKGSVSLDAPRHSSDGQYDWELPSGDPTPADTMMTQEFHDHLKRAMSELPDVFQKTIEMRELQGLSYEEIANITGVSLGTVKSRIARARQRLQQKLNVYLKPEQKSKSKPETRAAKGAKRS